MRTALLLTLLAPACLAQNTQFLPGIQQRWDASDLVCIGSATTPIHTGVVEKIDGADRDRLSADVDLETCLKGHAPDPSIYVLGDDVIARSEVGAAYAYAGPPTGFLNPGRNLLFLRRTSDPNTFKVTVPVYETAIPLADDPPGPLPPGSPPVACTVITRELEAAILQLSHDGRSESDLTYMNYLFDYLGPSQAASELATLGATADPVTRSDIAVSLLAHGHTEEQPAAIAVLLDTTADFWRRENAASALGYNGTTAALEPLRQVAAQPAPTDTLKDLRATTRSSLQQIQRRLRISPR